MASNPTSLNTPYLFLTGVVIVAVMFLFIVLQPMMDTANTLRHSIATDTVLLQDKQDFLSSLDTKLQQLTALAGVENQMAAVLPETERTQDVIRVLNEYAGQAGVVVVAVSNNSPTSEAQANAARARGDVVHAPSGVRTLAFEVNVAGSYEQVRTFLSLLGRSPRIIDVPAVSLKQVPAQAGQVTASITMHLYSQQPTQLPGT